MGEMQGYFLSGEFESFWRGSTEGLGRLRSQRPLAAGRRVRVRGLDSPRPRLHRVFHEYPSPLRHPIDLDPEFALAVEEIDRSLIWIALERSPFERLRAGVAMAKLAARFRREPSEGR